MAMQLLRLESGHGEILLAEGDPEVAEQRAALVAEFRRQLELGLAAVVPLPAAAGSRRAELVKSFEELPHGTERVIFIPPAVGGR